MVYLEIILAALKAIPALIDAIGKVADRLADLAEEQRKQTLELQMQNDIVLAKTKGDTSGIEKLFGKRSPIK